MSLDEEQGEVEVAKGLYCWVDGDRACDSDCMAYASPPAGKDYVGQQWAQCKLVVAAHQLAKHLTIMAQVKSDEYADNKRTNQPSPPTVR